MSRAVRSTTMISGSQWYKRIVSTSWVMPALLVLIIMVVLGIPYTGLSFIHDDYVALFMCKITPLTDVYRYFSDRCIDYWNNPVDIDLSQLSFFGVMFRPLNQLFIHLQWFVVGDNPYVYLLISVFVHALTVLLFFNFLMRITTRSYAFLWALVFGLHASLADWMGQMGAEQYSFDLIVLFGIFFLMKKYWDSHDRGVYALALLLLFIQLFMRETLIVAPACIFLMSFCYLYYCKQQDFRRFAAWFNLWLTTVPFGFSVLAYLLVRLYFFPYKVVESTTNLYLSPSTVFDLKYRFYDYVSMVVDSFGMGWVPAGYMLVKLVLLGVLIATLTFLTFRNRYFMAIASCMACYFILSWPCFLVTHQMRYVYAGLPFLMTAFVLGFSGFKSFNVRLVNQTIAFFSYALPLFLISTGIFFNVSYLRGREHKTSQHIKPGFLQLVHDYKLGERALMLVGVPIELFPQSGSAFALWMQAGKQFPVHYEPAIGCRYALCNNDLVSCYPPAKNYITVTPKSGGLVLESSNPDVVWFEVPRYSKNTLGTVVQADLFKGNKQSRLEYRFSDALCVQTFDCFGWDFEHRRFFSIGTVENGEWKTT